MDDIQASIINLEEKVSNLESTVSNLASKQDDVDAKLGSLDVQQDELNMKAISVSSELERNFSSEVKKTYDLLYEHVYNNIYTCGGEGGWRRVAYLDMTDPNTDCPDEWRLIDSLNRMCASKIKPTHSVSCESVFFPVTGREYTRVCGTIRAYQFSYTTAFWAYHTGHATTINEAYVAGVSLTHGSPRQHIWTFAVGVSEDDQSDWINVVRCPCDTAMKISSPPFVGVDYFCESGKNSTYHPDFAEADPLWNGEGCTSNSTCCEFNNPPYFTKQLSSPTTDNVEVRLCHMSSYNDVPIEFMELYVK